MQTASCTASRAHLIFIQRISAVTNAIIIILVFLTLPGVLFSQSLSDWQSAEQKSGCASIPYSDLRSDCENKAPERFSFCNNSQSDWNRMDPRKLEQTIEEINSKINSLKQKKSDLERERSNAKDDSQKSSAESKIKDTDNEIRDLESKVDKFKSQVSEERRGIREALSDAEKCLEVRQEVYRIFDRAISKANSESDPEISKIARKLAGKWSDGQKSHIDPMERVKTRINRLKSML